MLHVENSVKIVVINLAKYTLKLKQYCLDTYGPNRQCLVINTSRTNLIYIHICIENNSFKQQSSTFSALKIMHSL